MFDDGLKESSDLHLDGRRRETRSLPDSPLAVRPRCSTVKTLPSVDRSPSNSISASRAIHGGGVGLSSDQWVRTGRHRLPGRLLLAARLAAGHARRRLAAFEASWPEGKPLDTLLSGAGVIKPGVWTHVAAIVRSGTTPGKSELFVNGHEVAAKVLKAGNMINPQAVLTIGNIERTKAFFPGQIDEVRLFARAIDEAELAALVVRGQAARRRTQPGPVNLSGIAPWTLQAKPVDRFADPLPSPPRGAVRESGLRIATGRSHRRHRFGQWRIRAAAGLARNAARARRAGKEARRPAHELGRGHGLRAVAGHEFRPWEEQFEAVGASTIVTWFGQNKALDDSKTDADFTRRPTPSYSTSTRRQRRGWSSSRHRRSRSRPALDARQHAAQQARQRIRRRGRSWWPIAG